MIRWAILCWTVLFAGLSAFAQGPQRRVDTLGELLMLKPTAFATAGKITYSVGGREASGDWGQDRLVEWDRTSADGTNTGNVFPCRDGGRWVFPDRRAPVQDAAWWGAKGDGVTDDTAALQAALDWPSFGLQLRGTNLITHLHVTRPKNIIGDGVTIIQDPASLTNMLQVASSSVRIQGVTFNGRRTSHRGVDLADGVERFVAQSCTFTNFQEFTNKITTIALSIHGDTHATIEDCNFVDIYGLPDGIIGNIAPGTGFAHGIYINRLPFTYPGKPKRILIQNCNFKRILPGEDSDAIRWTDSTWTYDDANVEVNHCFFEDIGKRCIKASGSGGLFSGNTFTNSFNGSVQNTGWVDVSGYMEQYACISLYGRNHRVIGNRFHGGRIRHFIDTTVEASNCLIANNEFLLSTNWGLNGLTTNTVGYGTIGISCYTSQNMYILNNVLEAVQFGVHLWNPVSQSTIIGNTIRSVGPDGTSVNGTGRGIRFGRYGAGYPGGALDGNMVVGNRIHNFRGGIDLSESTNTFLAANHVTQSERPLILNTTAPDGATWNNMLSGGLSGAMKFYNPIFLHTESADSIINTETRGQMMWDTADQLPSFYNGARWASPSLGTRMSAIGLQSTNWYRVAKVYTPGLGSRGTAVIKLGSNGGATATECEFWISINYIDPTLIMRANSPGTAPFLAEVRVTHSLTGEVSYLEVRPQASLNAETSVEVLSEWTATNDAVENEWVAMPFVNSTTLVGDESEVFRVSDLNSKGMAFKNYAGKEWYIGLDEMAIGSLFKIDQPSLNVETPLSISISNTMQRIKRDTASGVLYAGALNVASGNHTHAASNIVSGILNIDRIGTGAGSSNTWLNGLGAFTTIPSTPSPTNGIPDAPADSKWYVRYNNSWTRPGIGAITGLQTVLDDTVTYSLIGTEGLTAYGLTSTAGLFAYDLPVVTPSVNLKPLVINESGFAISKMTGADFVTQIGASPTNHGHVIADTTGLQAALDSKPGLSTDNDMTGWNTFHGVTIDRRADTGRPTLWFYSADAPAISKRWGISTASGLLGHGYTDFNFEVPSDSGSPTFFWMTAKRLQNDVASVDWTILDKKMRINGSWVVTDALTNGITYGRKDGGWVPVTPSTTFAFTNILADPGVILRTNSGTLYIGSSSPVVFGSASDVTVDTSTSAETTVISSVRAGESKTLPANSMTTGSIYKLEASGVFTAPPANWDGGVVRAKLGGLTVSFTIHDADSWQPNGWEWNTVVYLTVKTAGASAAVSVGGRLDYNYSVAGTPLMPARENPTVSGTLNTTVANTVDLTFQNNIGQPIDFTCRAALLQRY